MTTPLSYTDQLVLLKLETVEQQDALPTGANAFVAKQLTITPLQGQTASRDIAKPFFGASPTKLYGKSATLTMRVDMAGSGAAILPVAYAPALRACGLATTICSGPAGTIKDKVAVGAVTGAFTFTKTAKYTGTRKRKVTIECTTAGNTGVAQFHVTAPATYDQVAYDQAGVTMTNATPFALGGGAMITPTITTGFVLGDKWTIELWPERVEHTPVSDDVDSVTIYTWIGGWLHKFVGSRGELKAEVRNGIPDWVMTFNGLFREPTDDAEPVGNFSAFIIPEVAEINNTPVFTYDGVTLVLDTLNFAMNNKVSPRIKVNSEGVPYRGREASLTMLVDAVAKTTLDPFVKAVSGALATIEFQHGKIAGHIVAFETSNFEPGAPSYQNDDDALQWSLEGKLIPTGAGNNEFLIYTA